nr:hypothetical protein [Tanacetum cinerariifolium]
MTSFGYRLNPCFAIKECSSCGALYPRDCSCPKGSVEDKILVPKPPKNYARCTKCGHPVNDPYCQGCALLREKLEEDLVTYLKYFQDTSESSDDSTNWAYLNTHPSKRFNSFCYDDDDDEDYTSEITPDEPVLSTEEPDNSLSMGDEHLDTIPATESDELIKSSVENLIPIPSESEGIPEHICDVPSHENSPPLDVSKDQFEDLSESNDEVSSIDDDSFSIDNINYVEASPPDSELVSSEVMEIVILEVGGIDDGILLTIQDDILRENLLNVNLLIAK